MNENISGNCVTCSYGIYIYIFIYIHTRKKRAMISMGLSKSEI